MNTGKIGYWVTTGFFAIALGASGVGYLSGAMTEALAGLGYPEHFVALLGTWKVLGAVALLVPALPRVKEWAYAGFFFNLTGAAVAHVATGDVPGALPPLVLLGVLAASYVLRPANLSLPRLAEGAQPATA